MAKRFTDTEKFIDPWFRRLPSKHKLLWDWILCSCDHAGIITIDLEFVEMVLKEKFSDGDLDQYFKDRVLRLKEFKYFIPKFIDFQYGKLNPESRVHASVVERLEKEGISFNTLELGRNYTLPIPYEYSIDTTKDKEKDKDKEKKEKEARIVPSKQFEVVEYFNTKLNKKLMHVASNYKEINARLKEGYTVDQMKTLIDHVSLAWVQDPFWFKLIRPSTMFSGKFDAYLQEALSKIGCCV